MVAAGLRLWPGTLDRTEQGLTGAAVELVIRREMVSPPILAGPGFARAGPLIRWACSGWTWRR
jgi:hypothetical protein